MFGFDNTKIIAAIIRVLNSRLDYVAAAGRYFKAEDIESIEIWWIAVRVRFRKGVLPGRRFTMVSKSAICAKLAPSHQEVTFARDGKVISDSLHLSTYKYKWDDSGSECSAKKYGQPSNPVNNPLGTTDNSNRVDHIFQALLPGEHIWTVSIGYNSKKEATAMKYWLWKNKHCGHAEIRKGKRTSRRWELKIWFLRSGILEELIRLFQEGSLIQVIKPNGSYRFMLGEKMLVAVPDKAQLTTWIARYLQLGYEVECHSPTNQQIYKCKLVDGKPVYSVLAAQSVCYP